MRGNHGISGVLDEFIRDMNSLLQPRERKPLKIHLLGLESEFMILDNRGRVANSADSILRKASGYAKKECARNMLEIYTSPSKGITGTMSDMLRKAESLLDILEKDGCTLHSFATYPGKFTPSMRKGGEYGIKEKIFGDRFSIAGRCIGFHLHYTLPRGVLRGKDRQIMLFSDSKLSRSMMNGYNILIAMDPVLTTFSQSSPFYEGRLYGKDSRMMFYRGSRVFGVKGLYTNFQEFGGLPRYKHTLSDIIHHVEDRFGEWSAMLKKLRLNVKSITLYGSALGTNWAPVKINPIGTLEYRGMDMNRFSLMASISAVVESVLKSVHERYEEVIDSDIGIKEPFRTEGDRIFIPPYAYVSNVLQKESAFHGMDSPKIRFYCSRFLRFSSKTLPADKRKFLAPLKKMLEKKRTVSDEIIAAAKKMGCRKSMTGSEAAELALIMSKGIRRDMKSTKNLIHVAAK